eukprot:125493-Karenia_brevis.AAC.1
MKRPRRSNLRAKLGSGWAQVSGLAEEEESQVKWSTLGQIWAKLTPRWAQVEAKIGQVGTKLRPSWDQVRASWAKLGPS